MNEVSTDGLIIAICRLLLFNGSAFSINAYRVLTQYKKEGKDQESIQSSTTPDPGYQW